MNNDWNPDWSKVQIDSGRVKYYSSKVFPFVLALSIIRYIPHGIYNLLHNKTWTGWPKCLEYVDEDKIGSYLQDLLNQNSNIEKRDIND